MTMKPQRPLYNSRWGGPYPPQEAKSFIVLAHGMKLLPDQRVLRRRFTLAVPRPIRRSRYAGVLGWRKAA